MIFSRYLPRRCHVGLFWLFSSSGFFDVVDRALELLLWHLKFCYLRTPDAGYLTMRWQTFSTPNEPRKVFCAHGLFYFSRGGGAGDTTKLSTASNQSGRRNPCVLGASSFFFLSFNLVRYLFMRPPLHVASVNHLFHTHSVRRRANINRNIILRLR